MIIAPDFVFVHLSKTGGTFAAQTLREMFCRSVFGRKIHRLKTHHGIRLPLYRYRYDEGEQHGLCNDISPQHRNKTIVSCIRNPFDLYVSEYTFNWWKKYPERWFHDLAAVEKAYPNWRDFSFQEFLSVSHRHASWTYRTLVNHPQASRLGWYSHKFIYYYCRDHDYVFEAASDPTLLFERVRETMYPVHFIHTETLNQELHDFLASKGYPRRLIDSIPGKNRINSSRADHDYRNWYTDEVRRDVENRDSLIFRLFPVYFLTTRERATSPMRIAYIAPYQGAALLKQRPIVKNLTLAPTVKIALISELLQENSHTVEILSPGEVVERQVRFYRGFRDPQDVDGNIPVYYSAAFPVRFLNGTASSISMLRLFKARHRAAPFDLVIVCNLKPPQVVCAEYAMKRLGLPVVLDYEDDAFSGVWGHNGTRLTSQFYAAKAKDLLQRVSGCMAISPYLLSKTPPDVPKVLLRGIVADDFIGFHGTTKRNWVVFSGTHERTQGLEQLIQAWQTLGKLRDTWQLRMLGEGSITEKLKTMAKHDSSVVFHGYLNRSDNAKMLCAAKIGVNPQDAPRVLGGVFAFKIIEYLAAGLHVITTPRGEIESELEAGISYIQDNRPDTIAQGLRKAIEGRYYERIAQQATIRTYGPDAVSAALNALVEDVVARSRN